MLYLKTLLTPIKIKDYVTIPNKHYENITTLLSNNNAENAENTVNRENVIHIDSNIDNNIDNNDIAKELSEYMNTIIDPLSITINI
jgi:predicted RNA-binding protein Jag